MKRIPRAGSLVWVYTRDYTGSAAVVDVFSQGEAADITVRDPWGRCWTVKKEQLERSSGFGTCPNCKERNVSISPDGYCNECYSP